MTSFRDFFLLDPNLIFLNHGSYGATPRPVFDTFLKWQRRMESQPIHFVDHDMPVLMAAARQILADYVKVNAEDLVYVPNATFGVNVVVNSLSLGPGDEVLATDHEYGACDRTWRYYSQKRGFSYLRQPIAIPISSALEIIEQFWQGVTERTKVIFISHITSSTALRLPVEQICAKAREAGIMTLVDGAHAPGQIPLDLDELGADFYVGNGHKWLCGPKGSAFIHVRRERQPLIEPLIVGWGWGEDRKLSFGSDFIDYMQWWGTYYIAAYLSIPAAIEFQATHNWPVVQEKCHALLKGALSRMYGLTGLEPIYPNDDNFYHQMAIALIPLQKDIEAFKSQLYDRFKIEIPCIEWNGRHFIRISVQGYNNQADLDALLEAMEILLSGK